MQSPQAVELPDPLRVLIETLVSLFGSLNERIGGLDGDDSYLSLPFGADVELTIKL